MQGGSGGGEAPSAALLSDLLTATAKPEWVEAARQHLGPRFAQASEEQRVKLLLQQLLHTDLNAAGLPRLPADMQAMHNTTLHGKLLLQLDEAVNIGAAARERYSGRDDNRRTLKLLLTDGCTQVVGLEYQRIPALHSALPAGSKLAVAEVLVRRGILLLTPQNCWLLGGTVPRLEAARQRMIAHWNQPAVGRRGPPPTINQYTQAATQAAWAEDANTRTQQLATQQQRQPPGAGLSQAPTQLRLTGTHATQQQQQQQQQAGGEPTLHGPPAQVPQPVSAGAALRHPPAALPLQQQQGSASWYQHEAAGMAPQADRQQQQQQQLQRLPAGPGFVTASTLHQAERGRQHQQLDSGRSISFGSRGVGAAPASAHGTPLPAQRYPQLPLAQPQPQRPAQSFSFHAAQQQQQAAGAGEVGPAGPSCPLQEVNGAAGSKPSVGTYKRSRLQLPRAEPSPPMEASLGARQQQQQQQQHGSRPAQPQPLLHKLHDNVPTFSAATGGGAGLDPAGTADDPIYLASDDDGMEPGQPVAAAIAGGATAMDMEGGQEQPQQQEHEMQDDGKGTFWEAGDEQSMEDDWADTGPEQHLDPWEEGYEAAAAAAATAAEPEIEAKAVGGGSIGQQHQASGSLTEEDSWDEDEWDKEEDQRQQQGQDAEMADAGMQAVGAGAADVPAPAAAAAGAQAGGQGQALQRQAMAADGTHQREQQQERKKLSGRRDQAVMSERGEELTVAAAAPCAAGAGSGDHGMREQQQLQVPAPAGEDELNITPVDDSLFAAAPSLAEVLAGSSSLPKSSLPAPGAPGMTQQQQQQSTPAQQVSPAADAPGTGNPITRPASMPSNPLSSRQQPRLPLSGGSGRSQAISAGLLAGAAAAAVPRVRVIPPPAAIPAPTAADSSDDDVPQFSLLPDATPHGKAVDMSAPQGSADQPFTYLRLLAARAAAAPAAAFPMEATVWGVVRRISGKLQFRAPLPQAAGAEQGGSDGQQQRGQQQQQEGYQLEMQIEDGTMVCAARLGSKFLEDYFGMPAPEVERQLADPASKAAASELVLCLQQLIASYSGLMQLRLWGPSQPLEVSDLPGALSADQAAALQGRAMCGGRPGS